MEEDKTDDSADRARAFAEDLCVVTDFSGDSDGSVTAEAAESIGINTLDTVYSKNVFEKLYPASATKKY